MKQKVTDLLNIPVCSKEAARGGNGCWDSRDCGDSVDSWDGWDGGDSRDGEDGKSGEGGGDGRDLGEMTKNDFDSSIFIWKPTYIYLSKSIHIKLEKYF